MFSKNSFVIHSNDLNLAYDWLCQQRQHFPVNTDIWHFRFHWHQSKDQLLLKLNTGNYQFSPMQRIIKSNGQMIHLWSSEDALVMKVLANYLNTHLSLSSHCTHLKGHGGLKHTVVELQHHLQQNQFVCKTDVKQFYESINQVTLMEQFDELNMNAIIKRYLWQVIRRTIESGGLYQEITKGIARGCSLSPILGAIYLSAIDKQFAQQNVFYRRYMDDIVILSKTRWQNRRVVKVLNQWFNRLNITKHPGKTFIGKIEKGFDFLGYHFSRNSLRLAPNTIRKHVEHINQLYEQQKKKNATSKEIAFILGEYVKRWQCWCTAGLQGINIEFYDDAWPQSPLSPSP